MSLRISFGFMLDEKMISTFFSSSEVIWMPNESKMLKKHSDGTAWKRRQELYRFCVFLDIWQHSFTAGILTPEKWESTKCRRFPSLVVFLLDAIFSCSLLIIKSETQLLSGLWYPLTHITTAPILIQMVSSIHPCVSVQEWHRGGWQTS